MTSQRRVRPELQEILLDVARDPRSHLLRVPSNVSPIERDAPVRDRDALLTLAERELVKVHRFEVADLLFQEVRRAVIKREDEQGHRLRYETNDVVSEAPNPVEWESRARYRLGAVPQDFEDQDALSLLEGCVRNLSGGRPSAVQLAVASLRLVASPKTRVCLGLALHQEEQSFAGLEALWDVLAVDPSDLMQSYAWQNIAELEWSLGRKGRSLVALRSAALNPAHRGDPAMSWFVEALQLQDTRETLRAAKNLEEVLPAGHASIESFIQTQGRRRGLSGTRSSLQERNFFLSISKQLPDEAHRIGHAVSTIEE